MWVDTHNRHVPRVSEATKVEHRQRLLEAAAAEFATKGLDGARVDDISVAAGLAKGTIYNYFESKQHVFREVVAEWFERINASRAEVAVEAPVRDQLLAVVEADMSVKVARGIARSPSAVLRRPGRAAGCCLNPVDEAVLDHGGQAPGQLRTDRTAEELARVFATLVTGLLFEHWLPASTISLSDIPALVVDYYLDGAASGSVDRRV